VRKQALATDVRTSEELAVAVAMASIRPGIVVHGDTISDPELLCAANVGVGRVMIDSFAEADYRAWCTEKRI
jgi:diaminopimelate decarboxylase